MINEVVPKIEGCVIQMRKQLILVGSAMLIGLSGCGNEKSNENSMNDMNEPKLEDMKIDPNSTVGKVPVNLKEAVNPTFEVGSEAVIKADHMKGMEGAVATIVGAYDTTAYVISYTPVTGEERVENHKWVIQEEMKDVDDKNLEPGTEVTIEADHMKGMKGALAEIVSSEKTTVYMINYTPTTGGEEVINHKWVTESELSAK